MPLLFAKKARDNTSSIANDSNLQGGLCQAHQGVFIWSRAADQLARSQVRGSSWEGFALGVRREHIKKKDEEEQSKDSRR